MRIQVIALAVLILSGAALAQNPLGDDSGPNANDGQCDDARFENIGAGSSNIVFWEGGRYDGRDATDCADLLLQGLIAWRRDTAAAVGPAEPETPTVAEARQQQATSIAPARPSGPLCTDTADEPCWMELDDLPDCYVWNPDPSDLSIITYSGQCSNGFGTGTGTYSQEYADSIEIPYVNGEIHGTLIERWAGGQVNEFPFVNGERHGTSVFRSPEGNVREIPYVNGEIYGTKVERRADGTVIETPYVDGVRSGVEFALNADGSVIEIPYVEGVIQGTLIRRDANGGVTDETPYVDGIIHGTQVLRRFQGHVHVEVPWVDGRRHGTEVVTYSTESAWSPGTTIETPWVDGVMRGTQLVRYPSTSYQFENLDQPYEEHSYVDGELRRFDPRYFRVLKVLREPNGDFRTTSWGINPDH